MRKKLIKKYQTGGPTRLYNYQPLPSKDKWNGVTSIKDLEGNELNPGDLVMATPDGKMVTPDNTLAYLDYMAANNIPILGPTLNLLTVTHNNQTGKTTTSLGEDFEDRLKRLRQDPVANDSLLRLLWLELGELLWNLSHDKHTIDTKLADKIANARTPEALSIMSPALLGIAAILGFESASAMAAWAAAYPEAFTAIVGSTLGGEIINLATNLGSGGQYSNWEDYANQTWGHGDKSSELEKFLWGATNAGYFVNPLSKGVTSAIKLAENLALNRTLASIDGPWALRALNTANKYNLGEGVKAGIYNTALSLQYGPEVAAKAGLNHLKLGVLDFGWYTKNFFTKDAKNAWKDMFENYLLVRFNPKAFKPSDRRSAEQLFNTVLSTSNYVRKGTSPNFVIKGIGYAPYGPQRWQRTPYMISYPVKDHYNYTFQFLEPNILKQKLINWLGIRDLSEVESVLNGTAVKFLEGPLKSLAYDIVVGGLSDIHNPNKVLSTEALEVNRLLGNLGHVTGSQVTVLNPYATHTPKDIDIITTQRNLPEVIKRLKLTSLLNNGWHARGTSSKYGDIDILVIQNSANGSKGRVAFLTYAKMDPRAYNKMIRSGVYEVPLTPEELLKVHRDNVLHFSNLDALVSGSPKHAERVRQLLLTPDRKLIRLAINDLENIYRAHLGDSFSPLESLGVYINYADTAANTEFLKKFGLENTAYLAESPDKMEFLIKYILYRTHMANRVVEKTPTMDAMDVVRAVLTNASYSNYGGNATASKFGGGLGYGGGDPYVGNIQYPISHPWKLKNAMDVYNYLGKMVDVEEPLRYNRLHPFVPYKLIENFNNDFPISTDVSSLLQDTLHFLNFLTGKERLYDILHHIVPNRNSNLEINNVMGNPLQREALSNVNDKVGKTLDITHIYSFLPGFNNEFIGKLQKYIPNIGYNIVRSSDANGTYFNGFELPRISLNFPTGRKFSVIPDMDLASIRLYENKAISNGMRNASSKVNNAQLILAGATKDLGNLYDNPQYAISRTKDWAKVGSLTGAGLGIPAFLAIRALGKPSMKFRREIWYNVPDGLYGKPPKQVQEELSKVGIVIDNKDLWLLTGWETEEDFYDALEDLLAAKYDK